MKPKNLVLTLPEYDRIFKIIYSVLDGRANTPHACMFFAAAGALLLNKHHKIDATAVAGAFLLYTGTRNDEIMVIGGKNGNEIVSNENEFHCWVQTKHHIIDFISPIFKESVLNYGNDRPIPRNMFQRLLTTESASIDTMSKAGDFFAIPNLEMTSQLADNVLARPASVDLLLTCDKWYKKYPNKLPEMALQDEVGEVHKLKLLGPQITGAW